MNLRIVENRPAHRKTLRLTLQSQGPEVVEAGLGTEALELPNPGTFDVMIPDIRVPTGDGSTEAALRNTDPFGAGLRPLRTPFMPDTLLRNVREGWSAAIPGSDPVIPEVTNTGR